MFKLYKDKFQVFAGNEHLEIMVQRHSLKIEVVDQPDVEQRVDVLHPLPSFELDINGQIVNTIDLTDDQAYALLEDAYGAVRQLERYLRASQIPVDKIVVDGQFAVEAWRDEAIATVVNFRRQADKMKIQS